MKLVEETVDGFLTSTAKLDVEQRNDMARGICEAPRNSFPEKSHFLQIYLGKNCFLATGTRWGDMWSPPRLIPAGTIFGSQSLIGVAKKAQR
jgi:hypothetical protein